MTFSRQTPAGLPRWGPRPFRTVRRQSRAEGLKARDNGGFISPCWGKEIFLGLVIPWWRAKRAYPGLFYFTPLAFVRAPLIADKMSALPGRTHPLMQVVLTRHPSLPDSSHPARANLRADFVLRDVCLPQFSKVISTRKVRAIEYYSLLRFGTWVASIERTYCSNSGRSSSPKIIPGMSFISTYFGVAVCTSRLT